VNADRVVGRPHARWPEYARRSRVQQGRALLSRQTRTPCREHASGHGSWGSGSGGRAGATAETTVEEMHGCVSATVSPRTNTSRFIRPSPSRRGLPAKFSGRCREPSRVGSTRVIAARTVRPVTRAITAVARRTLCVALVAAWLSLTRRHAGRYAACSHRHAPHAPHRHPLPYAAARTPRVAAAVRRSSGYAPHPPPRGPVPLCSGEHRSASLTVAARAFVAPSPLAPKPYLRLSSVSSALSSHWVVASAPGAVVGCRLASHYRGTR
jgi:hypothetical protein